MLYSLGCGALVGDAMVHILPEAYLSTLNIGDLLDNDQQNPLIYQRSKSNL